MVLTLYHDTKKPRRVMNAIKVSVDDERMVTVKVKIGGEIEYLTYHIKKDYQRLTVQVD